MYCKNCKLPRMFKKIFVVKNYYLKDSLNFMFQTLVKSAQGIVKWDKRCFYLNIFVV